MGAGSGHPLPALSSHLRLSPTRSPDSHTQTASPAPHGLRQLLILPTSTHLLATPPGSQSWLPSPSLLLLHRRSLLWPNQDLSPGLTMLSAGLCATRFPDHCPLPWAPHGDATCSHVNHTKSGQQVLNDHNNPTKEILLFPQYK